MLQRYNPGKAIKFQLQKILTLQCTLLSSNEFFFLMPQLHFSLEQGKKFPNPGQQEKQQGSKFIRPCCRPPQQQQQQQQNRVVVGSNTPGGCNGLTGGGSSAAGRSKTSDNVNQLDNTRLAVAVVAEQPDGTTGRGPRLEVGDGTRLHEQQQNLKSGTESWDGILTSSSFAMRTATSLSQIKSKVSMKNACFHCVGCIQCSF